MSNQVFITTLLWLESSLNSVIAHCTDRDIKKSLLIAKKALGRALSDVLSE
jgi:hypothetical protein